MTESEAPLTARNGGLDAAPRICVLLPEVETVVSSLQCAIAAAAPLHGEICAVHVGFDASRAVSAEEQDIQQLRNIYEGAPEARLARIKSVFDEFRASSSDAPPMQWRHDEGGICAGIVSEACRAQLLVISHPIHLDAADALHGALFAAHRLVLLAPRDALAPGATIGRHVVIGWKPGEATRQTIQAALPWLRRAERITALWVAKAGAEPYDKSARALFEKLGLTVEIVGLAPDSRGVGRRLLDETAARGGDCLLIGAFKHSSLWEALLGGVTRDVLAQAEIPVFMMRAQQGAAG